MLKEGRVGKVEEIIDVKASVYEGRLNTIQSWLVKHPNATMWRLAYSIFWRICVMAFATIFIVSLIRNF